MALTARRVQQLMKAKPTSAVPANPPDEVRRLLALDKILLAPASKVTKASVNYRSGTTEKECDGCSMFTAGDSATTGSCDLVAGPISTTGLCDKWAAK
jgi:hypothetical protein